MDLRSLDLNLLVVFDAMLKHRSVTRASEAVGLSQPATSAAVARLRALFDDQLFVKIGAEMKPTPRAAALAPSVVRVMDTVRDEILQDSAFDPAHAARTFTVITPDIGEVAFIPPILERLALQAPSARIRSLAMPRNAAAEALESGAAELAIGYFPDLQKGNFFQQRLFKTSYVCIVSRGHPGIAGKMTMKQFQQARHAVVSPDGREHLLERWLKDKNIERDVFIDVSHFMSLVVLLPGSDLIVTVPQDIATVVGRHVAIKEIALPFRPPQLQLQQYWHRRMQNDPANRWLRGLFYDVNRREAGAQMPG